MNFFSENKELISKRDKVKLLRENFNNGNCKVFVVTNDSTIKYKGVLVNLKKLFQKQLTKMPKEYILRQVFDDKHVCLAIVNKFDFVIGGICFRPFYDRKFFEIVFCAVDNNYQVRGIGSFMMNILKQQTKRDYARWYWTRNSNLSSFQITSFDDIQNPVELPDIGNMYLITYADNFATGYFKKQGFTTKLSFDSWIGYIKDYEGGTIMECNVFWQIDYMNASEEIAKMKYDFIKELEGKAYFNDKQQILTQSLRSIYDIPGVRPDMILKGDRRERNACLVGVIELLLFTLQNDPSAWPFLEPVSAKDVPEYYEIIKSPMDISTMKDKHRNNVYTTLDLFISDVHLMLNNCFKFNPRDSQYYTCAEKLFTKFEDTLRTHEKSIAHWNLRDGAKLQ